MVDEILFISPHREDARLLEAMLSSTSLRLDHVATLRDAAARLNARDYGAILTEAELVDGRWHDVLALTYQLTFNPAVLVTKAHADDLFWAEVLNLGAYDLLVQPFDEGEVQRILSHACSQVSHRHTPARPPAIEDHVSIPAVRVAGR